MTAFSFEPGLAARITRQASRQTYATVRWLVDRDRVGDAYRAYAYFRWVDDWLDGEERPAEERLAFVHRQQRLAEGAALGELTQEEAMLAALLAGQRQGEKSGLGIYIHNMMRVMAFDAQRRGVVVSRRELEDYTYWLASAVTEAMHYFIGHNCRSPKGTWRYRAVKGAHIVHMLRDAVDDAQAGYYNIPREVLEAGGFGPEEVDCAGYREWVRGRVAEARDCFSDGRKALSQAGSARCRVAGFAYLHRFEGLLGQIEAGGYRLRAAYEQGGGLGMLGWAAWMGLVSHPGQAESPEAGRMRTNQE
ncbi:MAG TPA: squalene/phytoene synthase family protein [Anaerolineales bacterium]|nr:squalene/phytoene synthase family protein [Anaerolineales bacterium]